MLNTPLQKTLFWTGCLAAFIGTLWLFNDILAPFILGIAIAYMLDPVMRKMSYQRIPRWASALFILTVFFAFLTVILLLIAPTLFRQAEMLISQIPNYIQNLMDYLNPYMGWIESRIGDNYVEELTQAAKDSAGKIVSVTGGIVGGIATGGKIMVGFITTLVLTPIVAFFMMTEWPNIVKWVEGLYPRQHVELIRGLLQKIDRKVSGFIRGQIIVAFLLGMIYAIALSIAGLNYGFLIGIGTGIFSIIPFVGSTLGLITSVAVAWFQSGDLSYVAIIAGIFFGGQFIEGNFLSPKVVGDSVGLHPLWILFALTAGGSLLGIVGMLIAVPVAAVIGVLGGFAIQQYKSSPLYQKEPDAPSIIVEPHHDV
jgi:predicted PurR-regulated permease PerM